MSGEFNSSISRRSILRASLIAGGTVLAGFDRLAWPMNSPADANDPFAGSKKLGVVGFAGELPLDMDTPIGEELDGRLYTDLSALTPENRVIPSAKFYLRSRASKLLDAGKAVDHAAQRTGART